MFEGCACRMHWLVIVGALLGALSGCGAEVAREDGSERTSVVQNQLVGAARPPGLGRDDTLPPDPRMANPRSRPFTARALAAAAVTTRRLAIIMVNFGTPDFATPEDLARQAFTNPDSMKAYYAETTYGKLNLEGDVFGPFQIPAVQGCDVNQIAASARDAAAAAEIDLSLYDHLLYFHPFIGDCFYGGLGEVGTPAIPARQTWYNGYYGTYVFAHEIGHNLGFWHAHSYSCGRSVLDSPEKCTFFEYGDPFDPMGVGLAQFNAYNKAAEGWFNSCSVVNAPRRGVFNLAPIETSATGTQALQIPISNALCPFWLPQPCYYYVEYRRPIGVFDGGPQYANSPMFDGLSVRVGAGIDTTGQSGLWANGLIDMTPPRAGENFTDFNDARLAVGRPAYQDPSGLRIGIQSANAQSIRVAVQVPAGTAAPTCLDGTAAPDDALCRNAVRDHGETDVDCGGPCAPCDDGRRCTTTADCWSLICTSTRCQPRPPACDDSIKNGTESDVDCGGASSTCARCADGDLCRVAADCRSGRCTNGVCFNAQLNVTLRVYSDWDSGFCGDFTIVNTGASSVFNWKLKARFADSFFTNTWTANYTFTPNNIVEVTPIDTNFQIWPHSTATTGFCAGKAGPNYRPVLVSVIAEP